MTKSATTAAAATSGQAKKPAAPSRPKAAAQAPKELPVPRKTQERPKATKLQGTAAAVAPKTAPVPSLEVPAKEHQKAPAKLVRDSFTMPQPDFGLIAVLKDRALGFKRPTKKSELLRAGLQVLAGLKPDELKQVLGRLAPLKTGRPKKAG